MKTASLKSDAIVVPSTPTRIDAVVGTSVAVCIWDCVRRVGGACQLEPPSWEAKGQEEPNQVAVRPMFQLIDRMVDEGALVTDLRAKIVGGRVSDDPNTSYARQFCEHAIAELRALGVHIVARRIGGSTGYRLQFCTDTGHVKVQKLASGPSRADQRGSCKVRVAIVSQTRTGLKQIRAAIKNPNIEVVGRVGLVGDCIAQVPNADALVLDCSNHGPAPKVERLNELSSKLLVFVVLDDSEQVDDSFNTNRLELLKNSELGNLDDLLYLGLSLRRKRSASGPRRPRLELACSVTHLSRWLVAIGSSTGGVQTLEAILAQLPANIPPILIAQHMPAMYSRTFAQRLNRVVAAEVKEARDGAAVEPGHIYLAPGGQQMRVKELKDRRLVIQVTREPPVNGFAPSVDVLFDACSGLSHRHLLGVLLTGMGSDGAKGLLRLHNQGASTIVQDKASCVVYGMPRKALEIGAARHGTPLDQIASRIVTIVRRNAMPTWRRQESA